jgi:hypothetical protein
MRSGFTGLAFDKNEAHPVEKIQKSFEKDEWESKMNTLEAVYGSHAAIRMRMERAILSQFQRLPVSYFHARYYASIILVSIVAVAEPCCFSACIKFHTNCCRIL